MKIDYSKLEKKIDYKFKNKNLLIQSLTHKSFDKLNNNEKSINEETMKKSLLGNNPFSEDSDPFIY